MKVLLPIYAAADAHLIVDFVSNYQWPPRTSFKIFHVCGSADTESARLEAETTAIKLLGDVVKKLKLALPSMQIWSEVGTGSPVLEIISMASQWKANMIVMGYRTRTDIKDHLAGSVSKGVAMDAPCSVAIIRPPISADENAESQLLPAVSAKN